MNRFLLSAGCALAILAASAVALAQEVPNVAGTWTIEQSGANGTTTSTIKLHQSGNAIVGSAPSGNGFTGELQPVTGSTANGTVLAVPDG